MYTKFPSPYLFPLLGLRPHTVAYLWYCIFVANWPLAPSPGGPLTTATTGLSSSAWPGTAQALTGRKKKKISPCKFYKQNMYIKGFFQKNSPPIPQVSFSLKYLHNTYFFMKTLLIFPVLHRRSDGRGGVNGGRIRSL